MANNVDATITVNGVLMGTNATVRAIDAGVATIIAAAPYNGNKQAFIGRAAVLGGHYHPLGMASVTTIILGNLY